MKSFCLAPALVAVFIFTFAHADAPSFIAAPALSLDVATRVASATLSACDKKGYPVSVAVVDTAGQLRAFLRADHSSVHTKDASVGKAYTAVTFGPIFNLDRSSELAAKFRGNVNGAAFASIPGVLVLPGGVLIKRNDEVIGAVGVSGSPDGGVDESCALAGVAVAFAGTAP